MAAGMVASSVWLGRSYELIVTTALFSWLCAGLLAGLGFLMITRFSYCSFKYVRFDARVPFARILLIVGLLGIIALDPPLVLWCFSFVYVVSGPVGFLKGRLFQRDKNMQVAEKND